MPWRADKPPLGLGSKPLLGGRVGHPWRANKPSLAAERAAAWPRSGAGGCLGREVSSRFTPNAATRPGPRIEPSPPPNRRRLFLGLLAGLAAGLIMFGTGGFILGRVTGSPDSTPHRNGAPAPSATGALPIYEQSQVAINQPKFTGSVAALAQGWSPYLSGCSRSGQNGGPSPNTGERDLRGVRHSRRPGQGPRQGAGAEGRR